MADESLRRDHSIASRIKRTLEDKEEARFAKSSALHERAGANLVGGVANGYHARFPYPIYFKSGAGGRVVDVDGNDFSDFNLCLGSLLVGHAHPKVTAAITTAATSGSLLGGPTEDSVALAEELALQYVLPKWRFVNSGSEATRAAIQVARGFTGADVVIKMECGYHGIHESVAVSYQTDLAEVGPIEAPASVPWCRGVPEAMTSLTQVVPFNCSRDVLTACMDRAPDGKVAAVVVEPILMNAGMILPEPGFLQMLADVCKERETVLVFDEVKTNTTLGRGGATRLYGVTPDIITLGKSCGGGTAFAAVGFSEALSEYVEGGDVPLSGTTCANSLAVAAARATLVDVMTDDAYAHVARLNGRLKEGIEASLARHGIVGHVVTAGATGCVLFTEGPVREYRAWRARSSPAKAEALWHCLLARDVYTTPEGGEEWTVSVAHTDEDVDRFLAGAEDFAAAWRRETDALAKK